MMFDRFQQYLDTLGRVPTDEEVADALRMSRRGFFGAVAGLAVVPHIVLRDAGQSSTLITTGRPTCIGCGGPPPVWPPGLIPLRMGAEDMLRAMKNTIPHVHIGDTIKVL